MPFEGSQQFHTALVYTLCVSSRCRYLLDWREEDSRVNRLVITSYLTHILMAYSWFINERSEQLASVSMRRHVNMRCNFFAYFRPICPDILCLICCPCHLRREVYQELKQHDVLHSEGLSRLELVPGKDKFFVFVSGGIQPCNVEEMNNCYLW